MNNILELKHLARMAGGELERLINLWIDKNIVEVSSREYITAGYDPKHQEHIFKKQMTLLGQEIAKLSNMHVQPEKTKLGLEFRYHCLVLKNDLGIPQDGTVL